MKLDNLTADEFQNAMCLLADVAEDVMNGELGAKAKASYVKFRSDSAKAKAKATVKAKGDPEAAKAAATAEVNGLAVDMVAGLLPDVLRQGGEKKTCPWRTQWCPAGNHRSSCRPPAWSCPCRRT